MQCEIRPERNLATSSLARTQIRERPACGMRDLLAESKMSSQISGNRGGSAIDIRQLERIEGEISVGLRKTSKAQKDAFSSGRGIYLRAEESNTRRREMRNIFSGSGKLSRLSAPAASSRVCEKRNSRRLRGPRHEERKERKREKNLEIAWTSLMMKKIDEKIIRCGHSIPRKNV